MNTVNTVRALCYLAGVLRKQQQDPLCGNCKAWVNSVARIRERVSEFEAGHAAEIAELPAGLQQLYAEAKTVLHGLVLPPNLSGQKKAGNCLLPAGVCLVKSSLTILEKI